MKKLIVVTCMVTISILFQYCSKKETTVTPEPAKAGTLTLPAVTLNYLVTYPAHIQTALTASDNTPADNAITNDGATLGRVLFYDKQLSKNNTVSCSSCHQQKFSFDDSTALSKGFEGGLTDKNSMALLNIRFYKSGKMFWDERSATAEKQALQPIQNHTEMGLTLAELESKVKALDYYPPLFQKAFGSVNIDSVKIGKALAQFERSIVTYQSKYDRVKQGLVNFTTAESSGEQLFLTAVPGAGGGPALSCNSCHTAPMFINSAAPPFGFPDPGAIGINGTTNFKSGSLRNIGIRTSLFHDGSIGDLQKMLTAGAPGSGTQRIPAHSVAPQDVTNLLAFLNTLTDNTILTEERFSNPFK